MTATDDVTRLTRVEKRLETLADRVGRVALVVDRIDRTLERLASHEQWVARLRGRLHATHVVREDDDVDVLEVIGRLVTSRLPDHGLRPRIGNSNLSSKAHEELA